MESPQKQPDIDPNFTDEEKTKLKYHFNCNELNQFYLVIILKVLEKKEFTLDNEHVIKGLLATLTKINIKKFQINNDDEVIKTANTLFSALIIIDITGFYRDEF